jgi:starch-binding outer membrane protein, SusD/RagB family
MQKRFVAALLGGVALVGCNLDRTNPNAPTEQATLSAADGVIAVAIGMQARYGAASGAFVYASGLLTEELGAVSAALVTISDAESGIVPFGANLVADFWNGEYRTIKSANDLIANAPNATLDPGTRNGVLALAYLMKAGAIGELVQGFKQVALDGLDTPTPTFVDRNVALARALALLDSADVEFTKGVSTQFTGTVAGRSYNVPNTIRAYRARFQRLLGNHQAALTAADAVDRRVFSLLTFTDVSPNPMFTLSSGSSGVLPRDSWRLAAAANDQRIGFHVAVAAVTGRIGTPLDNFAQFATRTGALPAYYPDEVLLIKAEALANLNQLAAAQAALDSVRTDCPGQGLVTTDPGACLTALSGSLSRDALLAEIYANRRIELFGTGLRWEDTRRLGTVGAGQLGKRCWLPYPIGERNANPLNVPADPEGGDPPPAPARCF